MSSASLTYNGDHTGVYDHAAGTGTVGKVIGGENGRFYVIVEAIYDPVRDSTTCRTEQLRPPADVLDDVVFGGDE